MEEVMNTSAQTPIEIALGIDENGMTTARALYGFLEMPSQNFARWAKTNIEDNEFYEENKDWWGFFVMKNGNKCKDYRLTTDFAKHLSMESHSAKGKIARQYFVKVEDGMKELAISFRKMSPELRAVLVVDQRVTHIEEKQNDLRQDFETFKMDLPILPIEADRITEAVRKRGVHILGGKNTPAYSNRSLRARVYNNLYHNLKYNFGVRSYKSIKRNQCDTAVEIIERYEPPVFLANQIEYENAQLSF